MDEKGEEEKDVHFKLIAMQTGENEQALRKIIDLTRICSMVILLMHFYYYCHHAFFQWGYTLEFIDHVMINISSTGLFNTIWNSKLISLALLIVSLVGAKGKKDEKISLRAALSCIGIGLLLFLLSHAVLSGNIETFMASGIYIALVIAGYILILTGGTWLSRLIRLQLRNDIFNKLNESFPQEERLLENEYSINLPAQYILKSKLRRSWINFINPFRALLVIGTPGAGKSYFVIRHIITQHIRKGFSMFIYDFKYDDLSIIAYNTLLKFSSNYKVSPKFYVIEFDKIMHRCNPLDPVTMEDITDASESSRTIMLGLNRDWIKKQGDFFVESPINFVTAVIWFLRKYESGKYCTLPHVIELMQLEYKTMFPLLRTEPEIDVLINPFESAYRHEAWEQLEGQIASAKIGMARLSSPQLYYVLSGNDFTLDINNPNEPKIICMGNNPQKQQIFGAVLSLYISRVIKLVNKKGKLKSSLIFDEFPTVYFNNIDSLIATARSNKVATTLAVQDYSQLKKDYGRDQAEVIMNIVGNVISGQVVGDTAKFLSERFGKIVQQRESISINRTDTSVSRSTQLDAAIPPSKIASLSSGEFVGMVADDPDQKIALKVFHAEILNDHAALKKEEDSYQPIPAVRKVTIDEVQQNYMKIKEDIRYIIEDRLPDAA
ncbi:conjugal transfer protein MobC [Ohtaekwangia koreensis]